MTQRARDRIKAGEQYTLWPDDAGRLILPQLSRAPSSGWELPRLPRLPRARGTRESSARRLSFFVSSLLLRSWGAASYFGASEFQFGKWLENEIERAEFGGMGLGFVLDNATKELGLDRETVVRLLIRATRAGGRFRSDGQIVTLA